MSILDFLDTGEHRIVPDDHLPALPAREVATYRINPPAFRLADATPGQAERTSFGLAGDSSGEIPVLGIHPADPAETARLTWTAPPTTYGPAAPEEPGRPWFYRGRCRWTRSRALLVAATWPGGVR